MQRFQQQLREHQTAQVLAFGSFRAFLISRSGSSVAAGLLQATVAWQIYEISHQALQLGLVGLVRFVPILALSLVGGAIADAYNRRIALMLAILPSILAAATLLVLLREQLVSVPVLYAVVFVTAVSRAIEQPTRQALLPETIPRSHFSAALALGSTVQALGAIVGPGLAGILIAWHGVTLGYVAYLLALLLALGALIPLRPVAPAASRGAGVHLDAIREGVSYVWSRKVLLGTMSLDLFAVIFGGAQALLPIYAVDVLKVGATGFGVLSASIDVGALLMSLVVISVPAPAQTGRALLASVAAYAFLTTVFGASHWFPLSVLAYLCVGAADQLSVVMRQITIQLATPDHLRGRVTSVYSIFVNSSNQLGALESGLLAAATSAVFTVVAGGIAGLGVVGAVAWFVPELRSYRATAEQPAAMSPR